MAEKSKIQRIHDNASRMAETLLNKNVDSVIGLTKGDEGWLAEVEVLERKAIPDTQDLLGRYEMKFSEDGDLQGYRRVMLRRRSDREAIEEEEV